MWNREFTPGHFRRLATIDLPELEVLHAGTSLTPDAASALKRAPWFARLNRLDVTANKSLTPDGLAALLDGSRDGKLRSLKVQFSESGGPGWSELAEHAPSSLTRLEMALNLGPADDLVRVAQGPYRLESLDAKGTVREGEGEAASRFFDGPAVAGLRLLDWGGNYLGEEGAAALAAAPFRETLRVLKLSNANLKPNLLTDACVRLLCAGSPWKNLAHLDLSDHPISPEVALELVEHPNLSRLVSLELTLEDRPHVFVKCLARSSAAERLRGLRLDCRMTPGAVKALIDSPTWMGSRG